MPTIYKICPATLWHEAEDNGVFHGHGIDLDDGYIHFSTIDQVKETAEKHFAGKDDLLLIAVDADRLGPSLRHEPARGGALFPHLYDPLSVDVVRWTHPLKLDEEGKHVFPELEP